MTNKEKFLKLVSHEETNTLALAKARIENRPYLRYSRKIALTILERLDQLGWKQNQLAEKMNVSPQIVSKWVKGSENFTIETIARIEAALDFSMVSFEKNMGMHQMKVYFLNKKNYHTLDYTCVLSESAEEYVNH